MFMCQAAQGIRGEDLSAAAGGPLGSSSWDNYGQAGLPTTVLA